MVCALVMFTSLPGKMSLAIGKIKQNKKQSQEWWTCQEETVTTTKQGVGGEKSIELIKYKINHVL